MLCLSDNLRDDDPLLQRLFHAVVETQTLTELLMAVWPLSRLLTLQLVEAVLAERARCPTSWPRCPACGTWLESKGFVGRQITSLFGVIRWQRRVGRCPEGCALAVFVPFATAAKLLSWYSGGPASPRTVWCWVQAAGCQAMATLRAQLEGVAQGDLPAEEPLEAALQRVPLVIGADGVMVPFRPQGGQPTGKTSWRDIKGGVLARLGQHRTRTGKVVSRLHHRRVVAVVGDIELLTPRLWLEAVRQGILSAPQVVWLSDGARGLWRLFDERFAVHATGILDFYHAVQNLWKGAAAWLDGRTTRAHR